MTFRLALAAGVIGFWLGEAAPRASGAIVVVANRTGGEVQFTMTPGPGKARQYAVASGDLTVIPVAGAAEITFGAGPARRRYQVDPDAAYYFADFPGGLDLKEITFAGGPERPDRPGSGRPPEPPGRAADGVRPAPPRVLTVKILVDQKEVAVRQSWEERLRRRVAAASQVLEHCCGVKLKVVAVEEWQSDDAPTDLPGLLRDFERRVKAHPAQLAIGFTSQRLSDAGEKQAGVTRMALHDHILMREWRPPSEGGRVDTLLHELGHYLGAVHSPEADSVMRPNLGDNPTARANRGSGFDPVNVLIMNLVAEEVFDRGVKHLSKVSPGTRERLRKIYTEVARTMPDDPSPAQYLGLLRGTLAVPDTP
jgi:hypothetical protein